MAAEPVGAVECIEVQAYDGVSCFYGSDCGFRVIGIYAYVFLYVALCKEFKRLLESVVEDDLQLCIGVCLHEVVHRRCASGSVAVRFHMGHDDCVGRFP